MSQLNDNFFRHLAQKLPGFKKALGEQLQKQKLKRNGALDQTICGICGAKYSLKTQILLKQERPIQYCQDCETALNDGNAAFVTVEKKPRFWIGKGTHPQFASKVTVVTFEQMDAIERANKKPESNEEQL